MPTPIGHDREISMPDRYVGMAEVMLSGHFATATLTEEKVYGFPY
jgi:hypothetical protein